MPRLFLIAILLAGPLPAAEYQPYPDAAITVEQWQAYFDTVCIACHSVGGEGGNVGPALDGVAARFDAEALDTWLADPQSVKPGTAMPNLALPDDTRAELVAWLTTLE